jgi:hypothetical protein
MLSFFTEKIAQTFFILALFPYVSFGTNTMDTQPHFIIFAIISFFCFALSGPVFKKSINLIILSLVIFLTLLFFTSKFDFLFFRGVSSYSGFIITLIASIIYIERYGIPVKTIVIANICYLISAILQTFYGPHILSFLVDPNSFADPSRGVISLTPEPTFFGIILFFFGWIYLLTYDYRPPLYIRILILLNIFFIVFFAKSSMTIVFMLVGLSVYLLRNFKKKMILIYILSTSLIASLCLFLFMFVFPGSRFSSLFNILFQLDGSFFERIKGLIFFDASINDRLLNVVFPYFGFIFNNGLPGGLHSFNDTTIILVDYFNGYFWSGLGSNKILSFIGAIIYELGILGLIFILYLQTLLMDRNNSNRIFELLLLFILLNSAIPVGYPMIPILMAIMYYKKTNS